MQEMGIVARLDQVIEAPEVIKHVLNGQAVLDHSVSKQITCCAFCSIFIAFVLL